MENRTSVHYRGNTLKAPNPGRKRKNKVFGRKRETYVFTARLPQDTSDKIVATKVCVWCEYKADHYFITCNNCNNCQYCGNVDHVDAYRCFICGNYLPDELRNEPVRINTARIDRLG